ncbi:MAG: queuosine precursor transporter [Candidatus Levybacteria bacterium]|nr:queuosine precursor transporter [Candidatus Levybacteria bacterium]
MFSVVKLDLLIAIYVFCVVIAEVMGGKTFHILDIGSYPLNASVALFVVPAIFSINDIVTEVYGPERMRSIIRSTLLVVVLVLLFSLLATNLPPSKRFVINEGAYDTIFGLTARISAASLTAFAVADFLDVLFFSKIRKRLGKKALWFRNNASNFISQFIDSTVFIFLAFYAFDKGLGDNIGFLFSLIIPYWLLKTFMSVVETPFVYLGVNWLKDEKKA